MKLELSGCEGSFDGIKTMWNVVTTDLLRISSCGKVDPCIGPEKLMRSCPALESLQLKKCCLNDKEGMGASWGILYFIFDGSLSWTREALGASRWFVSISTLIFCIKWYYWEKLLLILFCCDVWKTKVRYLICICGVLFFNYYNLIFILLKNI